MLEIFQYDSMIRAFIAGVAVAIVAPVIGVFLVLRRYSLIADTLAHTSLAGVAAAVLLGVHPLFGALTASLLAATVGEKLRLTKRVPGDAALSLLLSGSLALALLLFSLGKGLGVNVTNVLFGSILTVTTFDLWLVVGLSLVALLIVGLVFKPLLFASFDEEAAKVAGIATKTMSTALVLLAALVITVAMPVVGVLLISALLIIPVITALQLARNFNQVLWMAEVVSIVSVVGGIVGSFYFNIPTSSAIILISIGLFVCATIFGWSKD